MDSFFDFLLARVIFSLMYTYLSFLEGKIYYFWNNSWWNICDLWLFLNTIEYVRQKVWLVLIALLMFLNLKIKRSYERSIMVSDLNKVVGGGGGGGGGGYFIQIS